MRDLVECGHEFTVHLHGVASDLADLLESQADLVAAWEVIAPLAGIEKVAERVAAAREGRTAVVRWSRLRRFDEPMHHGEKARHVIQHGFDAREREWIEDRLAPGGALRRAFDGLAFRIPREHDPAAGIAAIAAIGARIGTRDEAMVRLAADNPAVAHDDEREAAWRVAVASHAALAWPDVGVWLDTFADVDRGYFPRTGLVDRRFNPRLAGRVLRNLNRAMALADAAARWDLVASPDGAARRWIDLASGVAGEGAFDGGGPALVERG
jgi:hypothetical protein